jgi:hypothetical protein
MAAIALLIGTVLIALGYYHLAIPPEVPPDEVVGMVKEGVLMTIAGGISIMVYMVKR